MNVKRYFASSAREALRTLKAELGGDAIVLSNRAVAGGVEILALPPEAINDLHAARGASVRPPRADVSAPRAEAVRPETVRHDKSPDDYGDDFNVTLSSLAAGTIPRNLATHAPRRPAIRPFSPPRVEAPARAASSVPPRERMEMEMEINMDVPVSEQAVERMAARVAEKMAVRPENDERVRVLQETNSRLMEELGGLRGVIERELSGFSWYETRRGAPVRAETLGQLLAAGFSTLLARQLAGAVGQDASPESAREVLRTALDHRLKVRSGGREAIEEGGVYALVGPTGVGKTTTVAKLAARFAARHGAGRLALITIDGYRIGAQEQLRIYGRILGTPVFAVREAAELRQTLADLRDKRIVLIDTMGMSQRDNMVVTQASMLAGAGEVRRLLLLNATCRGDTLDDVVKA
ncbi:MAG: flagellar biosynthesis protein FlhF, partial [Azoarcus sp.]|nr:flagellar biosynthesis protein FlhF [Azoarcus sp.]